MIFQLFAVAAFEPLSATFTSDQSKVMPHVGNLRFPELDSEALIVSLKDLIAIPNGSCTTSSCMPSPLLNATGMTDDEANECVRFSWSHLTPAVECEAIADRIRRLL